MIKKIIILIISLFLHSANAKNVNYSYIEAKYKFYYKNIKAGEMYLKIRKDKDRIEIDTLYDGNILAKLGNRDYRHERSTIQIKDNKYIPLNYFYKDNKSSYKISYNSSKEIILQDEGTNEDMALVINSKKDIHDPLLMLVKIMNSYPNIDNSFETISKGRLKTYNYSYKDNQTININNIKYEGFTAEYISGKKTNKYFFSKNHHNLMIQTKIIKKGDERLRIVLSEIISIK
jgi:hypothetical protein